MSFKCFTIFRILWKGSSTRKLSLCRLTGGEYEKLNSFFKHIGISHRVSCPHAQQQNGAAERKHRHIVELGLSLFAHATMPLKFWDEAFLRPLILSISFLVKSLIIKPLSSVTFMNNPTTSRLGCLAMRFGLIYDHLTHASSLSSPSNVCSLAIVQRTRASSV